MFWYRKSRETDTSNRHVVEWLGESVLSLVSLDHMKLRNISSRLYDHWDPEQAENEIRVTTTVHRLGTVTFDKMGISIDFIDRSITPPRTVARVQKRIGEDALQLYPGEPKQALSAALDQATQVTQKVSHYLIDNPELRHVSDLEGFAETVRDFDEGSDGYFDT